MEGALSKWTNVMKGWQIRWFVLDEQAGLFSYYTSKEKMMRNARRGCVRLKGAVIGIDDEDDTLFTITVDGKTFHLQARDGDERDGWIRALENAISLLTHNNHRIKRWDPRLPQPTMADFDRQLVESDAYLQLLIQQAQALERRQAACTSSQERNRLTTIIDNVNDMLDAIKHTIVRLQIAKNEVQPVVGVYQPSNATPLPPSAARSDAAVRRAIKEADENAPGVLRDTEVGTGVEIGSEVREAAASSREPPGRPTATTLAPTSITRFVQEVPETSYSSSEDEDWFDTEDAAGSHHRPASPARPVRPPAADGAAAGAPPTPAPEAGPPSGADYDAAYEEEEGDLGSMEGHGSVVSHLLSQLRIGMDLTRVVLPTFILERRSLLEMYADFFSHSDLFASIPDCPTPRDRLVQVLKWYLSAFHAGRKSEVAKKPYNPIIGETFRCVFDVPDQPATAGRPPVTDGPVPWGGRHQVCFVAEQVSHHPPVSAFYAEHYDKRVSLCGHIWTKSKFLGLSIGVHNIGQACVSVLDRDEEYILSFPSGYGRSILSVPWVELGGAITISCNKTGYYANVEFLTKPFYGGKKHRIVAEAFEPGARRPFLRVEGAWNGVMQIKQDGAEPTTFIDTHTAPLTKKKVLPIAEQDEYESRRLWKEVTYNLKYNNIDAATDAKCFLEQRQRDEAKQRKERNLQWETKLFHKFDENWIYDRPLQQRLAAGGGTA
ncbi:oxysterol-binding protein-related protein 9-like isoform X2 [Amphibalanus amphitrite]|uniref:oxysterol-binding protein-related protein 9-like isoform X2 n=1 Tax=Amphibalanus amphitrite TaxID=1232801 RepID=UPI001C91523E|nr:oxysterol-binding protein-related protein 9-like isoform X2 [Amphibalanus amphitrite]XP_043246675.1 oxysterol-binding protein-related protein 9-like isoform X2 [Amphibalanus amphitrite]XP_043246676.1 oxysterol-binding protein-related protein 9-like isoform X2 [Amphibalanus amphitrite]XP_043246677.1 oxysterol-binding protein-related protein 9-like isoform X2 [Amphibalanus amphitrite]